MALTKDATVVSQNILDTLESNKVVLGLRGTYYGLQNLIPEYPAACVESGTKNRIMRMARKHEIIIRTHIMVYHSEVQSSEVTKKEVEQFAEAIENKLHEDNTLDGLVIWGYVTSIDHGVARRDDVMLRAARLTWEGLSREVFNA